MVFGPLRFVRFSTLKKSKLKLKPSHLVRQGDDSLHDRDVVLKISRINNGVPSHAAELTWTRFCKRRSVEVFGFPRGARAAPSQVWISDDICSLPPTEGAVVSDQGIVFTRIYGLRIAAAPADDSSQLPTSSNSGQNSSPLQIWEMPKPVNDENLADIKIRKPPVSLQICWILGPIRRRSD